jgi:hypothetical protein
MNDEKVLGSVEKKIGKRLATTITGSMDDICDI